MADDSDDWISARDAVELLKPVAGGEYSAKRTIAERANDGLIRSRAGRFISGRETRDNFELPDWFWRGRADFTRHGNWNTGYFESTYYSYDRDRVDCKAHDVKFLHADIAKIVPPASSAAAQSDAQAAKPRGSKIFIGHGRSEVWRALKDFIVGDLRLTHDEFNAVPTAGRLTVIRLQEMLHDAAFAFLVLTGEDKLEDRETLQARLNVVHEAGLFQAHLGFDRAIILLEDGCEEFSNIHGLTCISFPRGSIKSAFHDVRGALEREGIIPKS
jgi:predicted nucleotide-binding protein